MKECGRLVRALPSRWASLPISWRARRGNRSRGIQRCKGRCFHGEALMVQNLHCKVSVYWCTDSTVVTRCPSAESSLGRTRGRDKRLLTRSLLIFSTPSQRKYPDDDSEYCSCFRRRNSKAHTTLLSLSLLLLPCRDRNRTQHWAGRVAAEPRWSRSSHGQCAQP